MSIFDRSKNLQVTITSQTIFNAMLIGTGFYLLLRFISIISWPLQLIGISAFLALALNPAVSWIAKRLKSNSRARATAVAYLLVLLVLAGFLSISIPPIVQQGSEVAGGIPVSVEDLQNQDTPIVRFINERGLQNEYSQLVTTARDGIQGASKRAVSTISAVGSAVVASITVLVMTFMMLVEGPGWLERIWAVRSKDDDKRKQKRVVSRMYGMVTGYVNGQLIVALIAGMFALIALFVASEVFNAEINAFALAIIIGLMALIPLIGTTIGAAIVVLVCLFVSIPLAVTMAVFFLVYQQIENATIQPYIQSRYNELTPLVVFIAALIGVSFAGFFGALIAIPIAGCIRIYILEYYGDKIDSTKDS